MEQQKALKHNSQWLTLQEHYVTELKTVPAFDSITKMVEVKLDLEATGHRETRIATLLKEGHKQIIQLHIAEAIATFNSMLSSNKINSPEAIMTMGEWLTDHPNMRHLTFSELKTFFAVAFKHQKYGKLYGGFGYDTLVEWFNKFFEERTQAVIEYRENQHLRYTATEKNTRSRAEGDAFGVNEIFKKIQPEQ